MPSISEIAQPDMSRLTPLATTEPIEEGEPTGNPFLRCALPEELSDIGDSLRQFYRTGMPQYRLTPPGPIAK